MKNIPGKKAPTRMSPEDLARMASKDKRKVIVMSVGFVILLGIFLFTTITSNQRNAAERERMKAKLAKEAAETIVYVPEFPTPEALTSIGDQTEEQQVLLNENAVLEVLKFVQKLTPAQLDGMGLESLTLELAQNLAEDPAAHRLKALRARGTLKRLVHRQATEDSPATYSGTLKDSNGQFTHFVVSSQDENDELNTDYMRIDGLFVQLYRTEIDREWVEAPLLVSRRLTESYEPIVLNEDLDTPSVLLVNDDSVGEVYEWPQNAEWELMAKAMQDTGQVDWENAPVLNDEHLGRMREGDITLRGKPFRIPIQKNMGTRTVKALENPFYRDEMIQGWMGDFTSKKGGLLRWTGAFDRPELHDFEGKAELVYGRGFFLKIWIYEDSTGRPSSVPYFVMASVDVHTPKPDLSHVNILWLMLGLTALMVAIISWLLARDKRQTQQLQTRLAERRRARQGKKAEQPN